jgi:hypothetical protein
MKPTGLAAVSNKPLTTVPVCYACLTENLNSNKDKPVNPFA